jgi:hypothetical protein
MQAAAGAPIMAAIAESYGEGGRFHAHLLVAGVADLSIDFWRKRADRRFGGTVLEMYDGSNNACRYFIQNYFARAGELHLEGELDRRKPEPPKWAASVNPAVEPITKGRVR